MTVLLVFIVYINVLGKEEAESIASRKIVNKPIYDVHIQELDYIRLLKMSTKK